MIVPVVVSEVNNVAPTIEVKLGDMFTDSLLSLVFSLSYAKALVFIPITPIRMKGDFTLSLDETAVRFTTSAGSRG